MANGAESSPQQRGFLPLLSPLGGLSSLALPRTTPRALQAAHGQIFPSLAAILPRLPGPRHSSFLAFEDGGDTGHAALALPNMAFSTGEEHPFLGREILIVARPHDLARLARDLAGSLDDIAPLPPVTALHAGHPALELSVLRARLAAWPPPAASKGTS